MPTEVITGTVKPTQARTVVAADKVVERQEVSESKQSLPLAKESVQPTSKDLEVATETMNKHVQSLKRDLHFSVDDETGETVIRVIDSESKRTIRTIPSEEFVSVAQQLNSTVGMLLNAEV